MGAKKASEGTTHAQLAAKAAETAEKVQVVKLKNNLDKENQKEKAVEGALQKDKSKLAQERVELNAALRKDQRLQGKDGADKARIAADKDKFKDMSAKAQADRARAREEEKKLGEKGSKTKEELAAAKANGVAQQAKDAIAEGQTKGQLTVVLGKLKANEATIAELRKEITELKTSKEGGAGLKLKARLVEQEVKASEQTASKAARQLSRVDVRLRKCEAKSQLKLDLCRKKQHAAEALAGSARARLQACTSFRAKTTTLMGHMAKAEATFQKCRKMLKIDEAKLSKTMQINSGLTTALADKQRKEKLASAKAKSLAKGLKICEHVAKGIEGKYKSQLQRRNTAYNALLKTWNTYKNKNKGLKICEKIAASQRVAASVCEAKLVGTKKELAACMGAENMLKQEGASLAQLKKMSHDKMVKQVQIHRKEVAVCRVRLAGLNAHLVECARCKAQMTHIKTKFQGVAGYLKANANK